MAEKQVSNYLSKLSAEAAAHKAQRDEKIGSWKKAVKALYAFIAKEVGTNGQCEVVKGQAFEQRLGAYAIDSLRITIGTIRLSLIPLGAVVIGAQGRVDMKGPRGTTRFIRLEGDGKDAKDEWLVSVDPLSPSDLVALSSQSLVSAFQNVIDGPKPAPRKRRATR